MTEILKTVQIDGDKNGFNSKAAINKFKQIIKSDNNFNLEELSKNFIKDGYNIDLIDSSENKYKFNIKNINSKINTISSEETTTTKSEKEQRHKILRSKIYNMNQMRTNSYYQKAKLSSNVPEDILNEYKKLMKVSKIPIPEPSEILANPEQYRPIISMVLGNTTMKNLSQSHPYIKYFKLLAKKIGAEDILPIPTQNFLNNENMKIPNNFEEIINMSGPVTDIKGNEMSKNEDTDSEEE
jgi:hypothetical protein